jgi:hypothetical protein
MLLEKYIETVNSWPFRIVRIKSNQSKVAEDLGWHQSKVSRLCSAKPDQIGGFKIGDYAALEGYLIKKENQLNLKRMEE